MSENTGSHEPEIDAARVEIGRGVRFGKGVQIKGIGRPAQHVVIGDHVSIGDNVRILVDSLRIGEFTTLHQGVTANGYDALSIGDCCWIGQHSFLNSSAPLCIGRGLAMGVSCSVWTHAAGGDVLQGFRYVRAVPASIGDDCYIGPHSFISPVRVGDKAMVLGASVVTHDVPENTVVGGNPAVDMTDKLGRPYQEITLEQRFVTLCNVLRSFSTDDPRDTAVFAPVSAAEAQAKVEAPVLRLGSITISMEQMPEDGSSIFDVRDRTYSKLGSDSEVAFMRYLLPHIKFYPRLDGSAASAP